MAIGSPPPMGSTAAGNAVHADSVDADYDKATQF
jgi:hypothetical protein